MATIHDTTMKPGKLDRASTAASTPGRLTGRVVSNR